MTYHGHVQQLVIRNKSLVHIPHQGVVQQQQQHLPVSFVHQKVSWRAEGILSSTMPAVREEARGAAAPVARDQSQGVKGCLLQLAAIVVDASRGALPAKPPTARVNAVHKPRGVAQAARTPSLT